MTISIKSAAAKPVDNDMVWLKMKGVDGRCIGVICYEGVALPFSTFAANKGPPAKPRGPPKFFCWTYLLVPHYIIFLVATFVSPHAHSPPALDLCAGLMNVCTTCPVSFRAVRQCGGSRSNCRPSWCTGSWQLGCSSTKLSSESLPPPGRI